MVVVAAIVGGATTAVASPNAAVLPPQWTWQNPLPQGDPLTAVQFIGAWSGWATGPGGTILRTTDGGETWKLAVPGFGPLADVHFISASTGWACGGNGAMLKSIDGGATWVKQTTPSYTSLRALDFVSASAGWACGNSGFLRTTNGGTTWAKPAVQPSDQSLTDVDFIDANTGWVVGEHGVVCKTTTGGASWITQTTGTDVTLNAVQFIDANNGWAVGDDGTMFKTGNGGATWTPQISTATTHLYGVHFTDANNGWVVGGRLGQPEMLHTTNGGNTWALADQSNSLNAVWFSDANTGWAVGDGGAILRTVNGGGTWSTKTSAVSAGGLNALFSIDFTDADHGWAVGWADHLLKTTDGGVTWERRSIPPEPPGPLSMGSVFLDDVTFWDANLGWAVGPQGTLVRTTDGGDTWTRAESYSKTHIRSVSFADANHGLAVASWESSPTWGESYETSNGGVTWAHTTSIEQCALYGCDMVDANHAWAVGDHGAILKTSDGGATWLQYNWLGGGGAWDWDALDDVYNAVFFLDANHGWAVGTRPMGNQGVVARTTDGGVTWTAKVIGAAEFHRVQFLDANVGYAATDGGLKKSIDGGVTWTVQTLPTTQSLYGLGFLNSGLGWVAGSSGILKWGTPPATPAPVTYPHLWPADKPDGIRPLGIAIGPNGHVFLGGDGDYVAEYTREGAYIGTVGDGLTNVFGTSGLGQVWNVAAGPGFLYAGGTGGVARFSGSGTLEATITKAGAETMQDVAGVAVDDAGNLFVAHTSVGGIIVASTASVASDWRVSEFDRNGSYLCSFGDSGPSPLQSATSIAVAANGRVYVADVFAGVVRCYEPTSGPVTEAVWKATVPTYGLRSSWITSGVPAPTYLACDRSGNVYVTDPAAASLTKLDPDGAVLERKGGYGTAAGQFLYPTGVVVAPDGHVLVADRQRRVTEFAPAQPKAATSITIVSNKSAVLMPRPFELSGVLTPGRMNDPCGVDVKKPGKTYWSYSSARLAYAVTLTGGAKWWYRYTPNLRGRYYFRVKFSGDTTRLPCTSKTISVGVG